MRPRDILETAIAEHAALIEASFEALAQPFERVVELSRGAIEAGGKLIFFGNGGSAADAQHIAAELAVRFLGDRPPIPALALTTDTSVLTACGNDLGFEYIFSRQIEAIARDVDIVFGISTSGRSRNVLLGVEAARRIGASAVGLTGADGGSFAQICDATLEVPSRTVARIQEIHILIGHSLCAALEAELGFAS
ncbi:SIS domain-containing protein [Methylosinus sporium]|uniref:Phosphoheptose isomerase n=1 Tax=Methylosinus sporium TaxID=428 RepID=A0A549SDI1_METSR|nr:SIS domain-containing protein [Methylosinus sporium]MBU3890376.1 SIS domain-containing protein [Methylosinus sp. KRF6]TRL26523.1 SIS domain-containing protein [Methylosinus sporium]